MGRYNNSRKQRIKIYGETIDETARQGMGTIRTRSPKTKDYKEGQKQGGKERKVGYQRLKRKAMRVMV